MFEGYVQEVAGAASRVEDFDGAETLTEIGEDSGGRGRLAGALQSEGGGLRVAPVLPERLDDGGDDEALHVGARGVVRAEPVALAFIQGAFKQKDENTDRPS